MTWIDDIPEEHCLGLPETLVFHLLLVLPFLKNRVGHHFVVTCLHFISFSHLLLGVGPLGTHMLTNHQGMKAHQPIGFLFLLYSQLWPKKMVETVENQ